MGRTRIFLAAAVLLCASLAAASAQKAAVDFRFNTQKPDSGNYLNWAADGRTVKDGYDAASGASVRNSTALLDSIRYDGADTRKAAIPVGLRSLLLFPLADYSMAQADGLSVEQDGKRLTIRFVHRGTAYEIKSDAKGKISTDSSFFVAHGVADNIGGKFHVKDEFLVPGGDKSRMSDVDWGRLSLVPDTASSDARRKYSGTLSASYRNGILSIKGNLVQK